MTVPPPASRPAYALFALLLACALLALAPQAVARSTTTVTITRDGDTFRLDAALFAPVPPDLAWEVLTDFDRMGSFVPNVTSSRVLQRDGNRLSVAQRGVARFGPLAFGFESERLIEMTPRSEIRSLQVRGNMRRMESLTRFSPVQDGTAIAYRVEVEPGAFYPAALTERFLSHEVAEQFDAIVDEMLRRNAVRFP
jgi:ribosome-associated toxin RatA of RatAB toxin-antitoxin module